MDPQDLDRHFQERLGALTPRPARLLLAVSGGPDSMALLALASRLKGSLSLAVGHVHHGLRGRAADADAALVRREAARLGLPFRIARAPVRAFARRERRGLEESARILRYRALARMARSLHCGAVVTAHTLGDQAETVFMNLLRGAGPSGLGGMAPSAPWPVPEKGKTPRLLRPLLETRRETLLSYLKDAGVPSRRDVTNDQPVFLRNRVRPALAQWEKVRPGLLERLGRLAEICRDEEDFWTRRWAASRRKTAPGVLDSKGFKRYHTAEQRRLLRRAFGLTSFLALERARLFALQPRRGASNVSLPGGWLERRGTLLVFRPLIPPKGKS
jgi:tRNA(Ile)-lysidine synthase